MNGQGFRVPSGPEGDDGLSWPAGAAGAPRRRRSSTWASAPCSGRSRSTACRS